ncbi:hypothetical protein BGX21_000798 [Mortierella sp. AD011]|nr:hypothetical protein BGX20_003100 [Mortierella sp. AD010]KAF9401732.1 hypothetical protein BGX21_000798 [Mortierella sp. AD011]
MSDDEPPIPASNAFTERGAALSPAASIDRFESPTSSTDSSNYMKIQSKKPTKVDITIHKLTSMIWRSSKLFAKKAKTITVFEHNAVKEIGKGNFGIVYQSKKINENVKIAIKKITWKLPGEIE